MDNIHNWINSALIVLVGILVLVGGNQSVSSDGEEFGAQSHTNSGYVINDDGTDDDSRIEGNNDANLLYIDAGDDTVTANQFTQGGGSLDIASGAQTLTQEQLQQNSIIVATASTTAAAFSWTFPASSTLTTLLPDAGDSRSWLFSNENASATTTTFVAGTGVIMLEPDGQNVVIAGGNRALITLWRDDSTNVYANVDELIDAD
jgi:hypothetical protein